MTGLSPRGFLSLTAALPLRVVVGRAAAERLGSEIGIEDRGALPDNSHPERSEGSRYTPIVNHLSINTSRRGGAFLYSRRGLRLRRRGAYSPVLTHGLRVVFAPLRGQRPWWAPLGNIRAPVCIKPSQPGFRPWETIQPPCGRGNASPLCHHLSAAERWDNKEPQSSPFISHSQHNGAL